MGDVSPLPLICSGDNGYGYGQGHGDGLVARETIKFTLRPSNENFLTYIIFSLTYGFSVSFIRGLGHLQSPLYSISH